MRFRLRTLFVVTAAVAITVAVAAWLWNALPDAHPAAVRNAYLAGKITLEEAREEVGDEADAWQGVKALRDNRKTSSQVSN